MIHIEDAIFGLALAPLTGMLVSPQHIFPDIPEAKLWPLLILFPCNLRMLDLLEIKLCHLNRRLADRQEVMHPFDRLEMHIDFVLDRRSKPSLRSPSMVKASFAVSGFPVTPGPSKLPTSGQQFSHICTRRDKSFKQDGLLCRRRNTNMLCASINP